MNKIVDDLISIKIEDNFNHHNIDKMIKFYHEIMRALFDNDKDKVLLALSKAKVILSSIDKIDPGDIETLLHRLPYIKEALLLDAKAIYEGDPACSSIDEVVEIYPGFKAISCYRLAHELYILHYPKLARILSEYAHSNTGIDINAGATIGKSFFIDHGTGIVIGETTIIGDNCKLYQGVTLGALSLKNGRDLVNKKRHPTLLNNVVIYSNASIFGGDTIIGNNVIIGSNAEIKESVPDGTVIRTDYCIRR